MRYFRVFTGRWGGELTIGKITDEQFARFAESDQDEYEIGDYFGDWELEQQWHEIDEIEHLNGPFADNQYYVTEIDAEGNEIGDENGPFDFNNVLYGREAYTQSEDLLEVHRVLNRVIINEEESDLVQKVLQFFSEEKGSFGEVIIETEGNFDPDKFFVGVCETDLATLIESYYYDRIELEPDFDYADTIGKAYRGSVGEMIMKFHDTKNDLDFNDLWEYAD